MMINRITATLAEWRHDLIRRNAFSSLRPNSLLGSYYIRLSGIVKHNVQVLDEGIPLTKCQNTGQFYHNPVTVCFYALDIWDRYLDGESAALWFRFLKLANWLVDHNIDGAWPYEIPVPRYAAHKDWKSAMAQGLAISVLCRAYSRTQSRQYLDLAVQSASVASQPITAGGCSSVDANGLPFLEEVATESAAHILNGAIFAQWGFFDLEHLTDAFSPFLCLTMTRLAQDILSFDLGYWSAYDGIHRTPARRSYHILHIEQMRIMHRMTRMPIFEQYANRWFHDMEMPAHVIRAFAAKAVSVIREAHHGYSSK